jgi:hypothetical protein
MVLSIEIDHAAVVDALVRAHRLTERQAADSQVVAREVGNLVRDWSRLWWRNPNFT